MKKSVLHRNAIEALKTKQGISIFLIFLSIIIIFMVSVITGMISVRSFKTSPKAEEENNETLQKKEPPSEEKPLTTELLWPIDGVFVSEGKEPKIAPLPYNESLMAFVDKFNYRVTLVRRDKSGKLQKEKEFIDITLDHPDIRAGTGGVAYLVGEKRDGFGPNFIFGKKRNPDGTYIDLEFPYSGTQNFSQPKILVDKNNTPTVVALRDDGNNKYSVMVWQNGSWIPLHNFYNNEVFYPQLQVSVGRDGTYHIFSGGTISPNPFPNWLHHYNNTVTNSLWVEDNKFSGGFFNIFASGDFIANGGDGSDFYISRWIGPGKDWETIKPLRTGGLAIPIGIADDGIVLHVILMDSQTTNETTLKYSVYKNNNWQTEIAFVAPFVLTDIAVTTTQFSLSKPMIHLVYNNNKDNVYFATNTKPLTNIYLPIIKR